MLGKRMTIMGGILFVVLSIFFVISCGERGQRIAADADMIGKRAWCPVTGDSFTIHKSTPVVVYKGERYYMCCPGCDTEFLKDPEKYILKTKQQSEKSNPTETKGEEIAYWTCSMHPEVRSDKEGNCPICGMTLIPVRAKAGSQSSLHLTDDAMSLAGIRTQPVTREYLYREIRLVGLVAYDPELVTAQEEYLNALNMRANIEESDTISWARAEQLVDYAEYRLKLLGMDDFEIRTFAQQGNKQLSLVMPQTESWVYADVYETDARWIDRGNRAIITSTAYPGEQFDGTVVSVSPVLDAETRAIPVRIRLSKPESKLKPGMYVEARIMTPIYDSRSGSRKSRSLAIPVEAVLDTGERSIVWVYSGEGNFRPRPVKVGPAGYLHGKDSSVRYYPVLEGLQESDLVVTNGNFLIDSESRITGVAAIGYGGALAVDEPEMPVHQH